MSFIDDVLKEADKGKLIIYRHNTGSVKTMTFYADNDGSRYVWDMDKRGKYISASGQWLHGLTRGKYETMNDRRYYTILLREFNAIEKHLENLITTSPEYNEHTPNANGNFYIGWNK